MALPKPAVDLVTIIKGVKSYLKDPQVARVVSLTYGFGDFTYKIRLGSKSYSWIEQHSAIKKSDLYEDSGILVNRGEKDYSFIPLNEFQPKYQKQIVAQLKANRVL